jgi:hypothetical protein
MKTIKVTIVMKIDEFCSGEFVLDHVRDFLEPGEQVLGFQIDDIKSLDDVKELLVKD